MSPTYRNKITGKRCILGDDEVLDDLWEEVVPKPPDNEDIQNILKDVDHKMGLNQTTNKSKEVELREKFKKRKENSVKLEIPINLIVFATRYTNSPNFVNNAFTELGDGILIDCVKNSRDFLVVTMLHKQVCKDNPYINLMYKNGQIELTFMNGKIRNRFLLEGTVTSHAGLKYGDGDSLLIFTGKMANGEKNDLLVYYSLLKENERNNIDKKRREEKLKNRPIARIFHFD